MRNILINIPILKKEDGGIYQYSEALIKTLAKGGITHNFFIFCNYPSEEIKEVVTATTNFEILDSKTIHQPKWKKFQEKILRKTLILMGKKKPTKDFYDYIIKEFDIDIIHTPYQSFIKRYGVKCITTLHDVQELHFPEFFTSKERAHRAVNYKRAIDGADAVIVSYEHVKEDIVKFFNKPKSMIHTVLLDMQDLWFSTTKNKMEMVIEKFSLPQNFLLFPAATWEHKNHLRLIEAIKKTGNSEIYLVCTGHQTDYFFEKIKPKIEQQNMAQRVKFLGVVSNEDLFGLYQKCRAVVIPTLYEAGSFPLMESILLKIPVICSNVTSLPETIGDRKFIFDPYNIEDIVDKIKKIWSDIKYREENISLSNKQSKRLKDNRAASKINAVYESLYENSCG